MDKGAGLLFVTGRNTMEVYYAAPRHAGITGPASLSLPGPYMEQVSVLPVEGSQEGTDEEKNATVAPGNNAQPVKISKERWRRRYERLAGAIGDGNVEEGFRLLAKACTLRVVVIGGGRLGSWLAFRLAQSGVGAEAGLIIADPDFVEDSNLDGMHVPAQAAGMPKAQAIAGTIAAMIPYARPVAFNAGLNDQEVVDILRTSDVVFTAVDENAVRIATAVIASRYHLLHIDVCGGTAWTAEKGPAIGGEVRVSMPGSQGCLACMGRYDGRDVEHLLNLSAEAERQRRAQINWHEQRPGSNVDVLYPLIGEALQAFWNVLKGELRESLWLHYEKDSGGMPHWADWSNRPKWQGCRICERQAGLGDVIL